MYFATHESGSGLHEPTIWERMLYALRFDIVNTLNLANDICVISSIPMYGYCLPWYLSWKALDSMAWYENVSHPPLSKFHVISFFARLYVPNCEYNSLDVSMMSERSSRSLRKMMARKFGFMMS